MKLGATDFLSKPFDTDLLLNAVREALARSCGPSIETSEIQTLRDRRATLSPREEEVLSALTLGTLNKVMAHDLGLSVRTIEVHRSNLMAKMKARSISELVRMSVLSEMRDVGS
jgi:two-component system response regulator FixJ